MKKLATHCLWSLLAVACLGCAGKGNAAEISPGILLENVRRFDGTSPRVSAPTNVLIAGPRIERISSALMANTDTNVTRIGGGGRVLMPGLIDAHWHSMFLATTPLVGLVSDVGYLNLLAATQANATLMRGASQIKPTAGGGVASPHSPLDVSTFTLPELRAAVEAADNWGTYVCSSCVHVSRSSYVDRSRREVHRAWSLDR